ncbi:MAG: isoleucine--tRNA ligase [Planctomycetota bacterium]|jgi:isoleucyl-tRNA synthetase
MFEAVPSNVSFPDQERELLEFWKEHEIFQKSIEQCQDRPKYIFYEGPPTANNKPHMGHVLTRTGKDVFLRYKTMTGHFVPRRSGWDTHGLPVEIEVEKELGIHGKRDIEAMGIEAFTRKCIESVWKYIGEWERMSDRVGFWLDKDGYATYHSYYVQSVWWALAEMFKRDLLYQDYKSVWWWPEGGTALSQGEVGEGYRAVDDPSVVVRFRLEDGSSCLAWTTTPWTLPSNIALAVAAKETYVEAKVGDETLIVAEALAESVLDTEYEVVGKRLGSELVGLKYEPLYAWREPEPGTSYEILAADFVTLDTGTGIVHIAPAFGEDDNKLGRDRGLGFLQLVEPDGHFSADADFAAGLYFKQADKPIMRELKERGLLWSQKTYRHDYPFCPRAENDPLIQYSRKSWFIRTSPEKQKVLANNAEITWQPESIRDGRMGDFLRNNVDWAISRERWWGTPLPIWINDETGAMDAVASVDEILERNPEAFAHFEEAKRKDPNLDDNLMVHKPWIDHVTWTNKGEAGTYRRVPEVIDCWFDAGSMPFAQWGYPHRNKDKFDAAFPAHFITEAIDQTRGWWNALLQISTLLFGDHETPHPFRSCVVLSHIVAQDGRKLSKRLKNYEPPMEALEHYSADAVRWALLSNCVPGQKTRFWSGPANDAVRELLLKVWNVLSFFVTYARIDGWTPGDAPAQRGTLDRWILAELDQTVRDVRAAFDRLESHIAARRIQRFVDGLSNWYVRRSRDRFWAEGDSDDKHAAFATLHECLIDVARLLAPFTPFIAESLHQRLGCEGESVHLCEYPDASEQRRDDTLRESMGLVRDMVALGLSVRATQKIKVRQPLPDAVVVLHDPSPLEGFTEMIREELNVKLVELSTEPEKYVTFEIVPNFRALGPKLGKNMPACKQSLAQADGSELYAKLESGGGFDIEVGGETIRLTHDEVEIRLQAKEGFAAASEGGKVILLDTRIDETLRMEGLAREVVNRLQGARKKLDLAYEARIEVSYAADGELAAAIEAHRDAIASETLARSLAAGAASAHEADVDGHAFAFDIRVCDAS